MPKQSTSVYITHIRKSFCYFTLIIVLKKIQPLYLYLIPLTFFAMVHTSLEAQTKKEYREQMEKEEQGYVSKDVSDTAMTKSLSDGIHFTFPNINEKNYYHNSSQLQKIDALNKSGDEDVLINKLEQYIQQFGIKNFSKDTHLLWTLAQLYEEKGKTREAKYVYRLVLKHHRRDELHQVKQYFKIRDHLDDISELDKDYYVPLDHYYELVEYRKLIDTLHPPHSVHLNMGELINKKNVADYAPSISRNDDYMIFTRKTPDNKSVKKDALVEDLYYSKNYEGFWDEAQLFPEPVNTKCNEGSACLSADGKTLYFTRCVVEEHKRDCNDCMGSCDLYITEMQEDSTWSKPENLGENVNSVSWDSHPTLSPTEDTLYFASSRKEGFGLSDIWFTVRTGKGEWSKAQNMGPMINTRNNEYSPFINQVHNVFYFSSNGHLLNFGDLENKKNYRTLDIYKSYPVDGEWSEPKNVGPLVNGEDDEFYFTMDSKADKLFYAKTEPNCEKESITDLYSFPVPMEAQPTATTKLKGKLVDEETGETYEGIVSVIDLRNGIEVAPKNVRPDGTYEFDLIDHNDYLLIIQGDEFFRIEKLFTMDGDTTIESKATSVNRRLTFSSIVFENGKAEILEEMEEDLWEVINFLVDNPSFKLTISGHTDGDGNQDLNMKLSQERADAIKEFIMEEGYIEDERIKAIGYGSTKPIRSPEETEKDKRINRRVEFDIYKPEGRKDGD